MSAGLIDADRERLRLISEQLPAVLWTTDGNLTFTSVYGRALDGLRQAGKAPPRSVAELFGTDDSKHPALGAHRSALGGTAVSYETEWAGRVWVSHVEPLRDNAGTVVGVIGLASDVTTLKNAENALRASDLRFRQMAETIAEVFWMADPQTGRVLYVSPAFERVWGRDPAPIYDDPSLFMTWMHPDDRARVMHAQQTAMNGWDTEYRVLRPDGSVRWIRDRGFPSRDDTGQVTRLAGISEDITTRKRLEDQLLQAQKMDALGRLAGGVAHDFNNTLTAVLACAEALTSASVDDAERVTLAKQILVSCEHATAVTRQLLLFSRKRAAERKAVDLNEVVRRLHAMLRRLLGETVALDVQLCDTSPVTEADANHIEQVLINLAVNAKDALPDGGRITISTAVAQGDGKTHVRLSVEDSGSGIDPEILPHIFEPFFTTKEQGKGTGLGLSTVHGIVEQSGGHIVVQSGPGRGTRFDVMLPSFAPPPLTAVPANPTEPRARGSETILVAEDDEAIRRLLRRGLESEGYRVMLAPDGKAAFELIKANAGAVDLLLSDCVMPEMSGAELAAAARTIRPSLRVLFMTGYLGHDASPEQGPDAADVIEKPFSTKALLLRVRAALDK